MTASSFTGGIVLGHLLASAGVELDDVVVLRHTFTDTGLRSAADLTSEKVLAYTREQGRQRRLGRLTPIEFETIYAATHTA